MSLSIGIARRNATPPLGTVLFGYPQMRASQRVADPLAATALVLRSGEIEAALVSVDICEIDAEDTAAIRADVHAATGIPPANISITATHTHSGPVTVTCYGWGVKDLEYMSFLRARILEAVVDAHEALHPVRVGIAKGATDVGVNRRWILPDGSVTLGMREWGARDRDLTVVRFEGEDGPLAQIVSLGAHGTAQGTDLSISRDWFGEMTDRIEHATGAPVLFLNGACGDISPRMAIGGGIGDGLSSLCEVGLRAAVDAMAVWRSIKDFQDVPFETYSFPLPLPIEALPALEAAREEYAKLEGHENSFGVPGCEWHYWSSVIEAHEKPPVTTRVFGQTIFRLGPLVIVPFPGEIFSEIALRLKTLSPFSYTLCIGNSNGSNGYFCTREEHARGGYEPWHARAFGAYLPAGNTDDVLVAENLRALQAMHNI